MAIFPEPREDLFAEATAMPMRGECVIVGEPTRFFVGLRPHGALSLYCDEAPVLHFNRAGALRRAFVGGEQFVAQGGKLIRRRRSPPGGQVTLADEGLEAAETEALRQTLQPPLSRIAAALAEGKLEWQRVTSAEALQAALKRLLPLHAEQLWVADAPEQ